MNIVFIGSVMSSRIVLEEIIEMNIPISLVCSLDEKYSQNVSGYNALHELAEAHGIPYVKFHKINEACNIEKIKDCHPDYIFVIGLSQLVSEELLSIPTKGCIGFHPTPLPKFRGRAAMVWQMLLGVHETKCTLFFLNEKMDAGDILGQEEYFIGDEDYAEDVEKKLYVALRNLSKRVLAGLVNDTIVPVPQKEEEATYLLIRRPEDGIIDWEKPIAEIYRLVRAVSHPYPGAFTMYDGVHKIIIWKAKVLENKNIIGMPGQICRIEENYFDVLGVNGILHVTDYDNVDCIKLYVGHKCK